MKHFVTTIKPRIDFEKLGYDTVVQTRDEVSAIQICGLHVHAYADDMRPELSSLSGQEQIAKARTQSLCSHLYDRAVPAGDAGLLGRKLALAFIASMLLIAGLASVVGHSATFYLYGFGLLISILSGAALTGLVLAVGYRTFEVFLSRFWVLESIVVAGACLLCFLGLFQLAQARAMMAEKKTSTVSSSSYVDGQAQPDKFDDSSSDVSTEDKIKQGFSAAIVNVMLSADLVIGILLGVFIKARSDEDYAAWTELVKLTQELKRLRRRSGDLLASIETAKKRCMAGILKGSHSLKRKQIPYHRVLPILILSFSLAGGPLSAQTIERQRAILIDVSSSVGGSNGDTFREYLVAVRKLLSETPPNTRVTVLLITNDSFGSVRQLLSGWTPDVRGVFTDELSRARRELVKEFQTKSSGLLPNSAGTDIIGAIWSVKAGMESYSQAKNTQKEIWIFSDMINQTHSLNMAAEFSLGAEQMLSLAKGNELIPGLRNYNIYVEGATTHGLSPRTWLCVKEFWVRFFGSTGAVLKSYSPGT